MRIRLLGKDRAFASPDRSVYSLKRDQSGNSFTLTVPIDVWVLERRANSDLRESNSDARESGPNLRGPNPDTRGPGSALRATDVDFGILRSPLAGWGDAELAMSQSPKGFARLAGNQPSFTTGGFSSVVRCVTNSSFKVREDSQEDLAERVSRLDIFPRSEVTPGLAVGIQQSKGMPSPRGEISRVDQTFLYEFLGPMALTVPRLTVFQVNVPNRLNSRMIGSPVIARRPEEPPKLLGMLVGLINQSDGRSNAFVLPAEELE